MRSRTTIVYPARTHLLDARKVDAGKIKQRDAAVVPAAHEPLVVEAHGGDGRARALQVVDQPAIANVPHCACPRLRRWVGGK